MDFGNPGADFVNAFSQGQQQQWDRAQQITDGILKQHMADLAEQRQNYDMDPNSPHNRVLVSQADAASKGIDPAEAAMQQRVGKVLSDINSAMMNPYFAPEDRVRNAKIAWNLHKVTNPKDLPGTFEQTIQLMYGGANPAAQGPGGPTDGQPPNPAAPPPGAGPGIPPGQAQGPLLGPPPSLMAGPLADMSGGPGGLPPLLNPQSYLQPNGPTDMNGPGTMPPGAGAFDPQAAMQPNPGMGSSPVYNERDLQNGMDQHPGGQVPAMIMGTGSVASDKYGLPALNPAAPAASSGNPSDSDLARMMGFVNPDQLGIRGLGIESEMERRKALTGQGAQRLAQGDRRLSLAERAQPLRDAKTRKEIELLGVKIDALPDWYEKKGKYEAAATSFLDWRKQQDMIRNSFTGDNRDFQERKFAQQSSAKLTSMLMEQRGAAAKARALVADDDQKLTTAKARRNELMSKPNFANDPTLQAQARGIQQAADTIAAERELHVKDFEAADDLRSQLDRALSESGGIRGPAASATETPRRRTPTPRMDVNALMLKYGIH